MKSNNVIPVSIGVLLGLAAGLIIGLMLTNPGLSLMEVAGTIGKVDKYRNVKITQEDIALRDDLLADAALRESYRNYLIFEYASNVKMADDIQFALSSVHADAAFRGANRKAVEDLQEFVLFLDNARLQILEAIGVLDELNEKDRVAVRTALNDAGNALAQTVYRATVVADFITCIEHFMGRQGQAVSAELAHAHDLLFMNLLSSCLMREDRAVLHFLMERDLLSNDENLSMSQEDFFQRLSADAGKIPSVNPERIRQAMDPSVVAMGLDFRLLGNLADAQRLGIVVDAQRLGTVMDAQRLGTVMDAQRLGITMDSQRLGINFDSQKLGSVLEGRSRLKAL